MNISFLSIAYFQKLAQLEHMSKAAEELHVSQPALSKTIAQIERELGVELFDRKGRGITLNAYGRLFLKYTNRITQEIDSLTRELEAQKIGDSTTISLSLHVASTLIPKILMDYSKIHPEVHYRLIQQEQEMADTPGLASADADLTIFSGMTPIENDHSVVLLEENLKLAMPCEDPETSDGPVDLSDYAEAEFICLQKGKSLRTITDFYCMSAGFSPKIILESDSPQTVREFIRAGIGISLVPEVTWKNVIDDNIVVREVARPKCRRYIGLSWNKDRYMSPAVDSLREYLIENFRKTAYRS